LNAGRLVKLHGRRWAKIGKILMRKGTDCRDQYREYIELGAKKRLGVWFCATVRLCPTDFVEKHRSEYATNVVVVCLKQVVGVLAKPAGSGTS
jgi:hypothetical protein